MSLDFRKNFTFVPQLFSFFWEYALTFIKGVLDPLEPSEKIFKWKNVGPSKTSIIETH